MTKQSYCEWRAMKFEPELYIEYLLDSMIASNKETLEVIGKIDILLDEIIKG
jgi:hypothetical protein